VDETSIAPPVRNIYDRHEKDGIATPSTLSLEQWSEVLVELILLTERTTLIVDALDETDDSDELLLQLKNVSDRVDGKLRLFVSSRMQVDVPRAFPHSLDVKITPSESSSDMAEYIRSEVTNRKTRRLLNGREPALEQRLIEVLTLRAEGM
jgi:hypothetical protein